MAQDLSQRVPGISVVGEAGPENQGFPTVDALNESFIDRMARGAYLRQKNMVGAPESQILGAIDVQETSYVNAFKEFWEKKGMPVDNMARKLAWQKVRKMAIDRYAAYIQNPPTEAPATRASPVPKPIVEPPPTPAEEPEEYPVAEIIPEVPENLLIDRWYKWNMEKLSAETLGNFNARFVWELSRAMSQLSKDPSERDSQMKEIRGIYDSIVFRMYQNANPGIELDTLREEFQRALPSYWQSVLEALRLHTPQS
ncbi:MAG TPA: hypothetical protein VJ553_01285 [Candidatus Paceibacterota bacterium]|nr:hypothetical protein [Candidatus Paceibacterota bacterium]